ncbi:beta-lactamase-like protein [Protomyces lactucae-debilis]|uniref:Beta-lactamase-like protein n=1 Tax=Protomyces lactucae-debilis TaxID=2754530 RepID=A0A1Y2FDM9_PROLT|nr:beta-lactamase-like protein [Protomyces lactucae-debilis]ORY81524.1 beta-lactamase-like protein [Protomyces lactucae-debilis]
MNTLPKVPDIARLSPRVIRILGQNGPSKFVLQGTNTYLIGTGPERILLDTGDQCDAYLPFLAKVLDEERCTITKVLLSHWHHDHVEGLPGVRQLLAQRDAKDSHALQVWKFPHEDDEADWQALKDNDEIQTTGATLRALHTPGHASDHLSFLLLEEGAVFTADMILGGSTSVFEDLSAYMASLRKLQALGKDLVGRLYPGHGLEMENGLSVVQEYIHHRQAREDEIVKLLRHRAQSQGLHKASAMDLVKVIYKDVNPDLYPAAAHGVDLHLQKLQQDGQVEGLAEEDGQGDAVWRLKPNARI